MMMIMMTMPLMKMMPISMSMTIPMMTNVNDPADDDDAADDAADRQADNGGGNDKVITVLTSGPHLNLAGRHPPSQIFDCHHEHDEQDGYDDDEGVLCLYLGSTCTYHTQ